MSEKAIGPQSQTSNQAGEVAGYVYLIHHPESGAYKIGRSVNPSQRLGQIAKRSAGLVLVGSIPTADPDWLEKMMHGAFSHRRIKNEWFRLDETDTALFLSIPSADRVEDLPHAIISMWAANEAEGFEYGEAHLIDEIDIPGVSKLRSRYLPKPEHSHAIRLDWDDALRKPLAHAAAECDLSTAALARLVLEMFVAGRSTALTEIAAEAEKRLGKVKKKPKKST